MFANGVDKDMVVLMVARTSKLENQDAIDCAIVNMLADPKEVERLFLLMKDNKNLLLVCFGFR